MDSNDLACCRVCHGDSEPNRPLFHPCRCSGSIKFIHQDCLVEWLRVSMKGSENRCELCGEKFQFRSVYSTGERPPELSAIEFLQGLYPIALNIFDKISKHICSAVAWLFVLPLLTSWWVEICSAFVLRAQVVPLKYIQNSFKSMGNFFVIWWNGVLASVMVAVLSIAIYQVITQMNQMDRADEDNGRVDRDQNQNINLNNIPPAPVVEPPGEPPQAISNEETRVEFIQPILNSSGPPLSQSQTQSSMQASSTASAVVSVVRPVCGGGSITNDEEPLTVPYGSNKFSCDFLQDVKFDLNNELSLPEGNNENGDICKCDDNCADDRVNHGTHIRDITEPDNMKYSNHSYIALNSRITEADLGLEFSHSEKKSVGTKAEDSYLSDNQFGRDPTTLSTESEEPYISRIFYNSLPERSDRVACMDTERLSVVAKFIDSNKGSKDEEINIENRIAGQDNNNDDNIPVRPPGPLNHLPAHDDLFAENAENAENANFHRNPVHAPALDPIELVGVAGAINGPIEITIEWLLYALLLNMCSVLVLEVIPVLVGRCLLSFIDIPDVYITMLKTRYSNWGRVFILKFMIDNATYFLTFIFFLCKKYRCCT